MQKTTMIAIAIAAIAGPLIRYVALRPGRSVSRWLERKLPDGRLKRLLLRPVRQSEPDTWPELPPNERRD